MGWEEHAPPRFETAGHYITVVGSALSFVGSVITILSFVTFPWLRKHPRELYFWFAISLCLEGLLTLVIALCWLETVPSDNRCVKSTLEFCLIHFCRLSEGLWLCCIAHAVHTELTDTVGPPMARDSRSVQARWRRRARHQRLYHAVGWGVPLTVTLTTMFFYDACKFHLDSVGSNSIHLLDEVLTLLTFLFNVGLFVPIVLKARQCMHALQVGDEGAMIDTKSMSYLGVYVGIFVSFGIVRLPFILLIATVQISLERSAQMDDAFWQLWLCGVAFRVVLGFSVFCWFAYKFRFGALWRNRLVAWLGLPHIDDPLIETVVGVY